mgnify:FL=1
MYVWSSPTTLINTTIANNTALISGGGIGTSTNVNLNIENSIVAGNTAPSGPDIFKGGGLVIPAGANLIGNNDTVSTDFPEGPLHGTPGTPPSTVDAMLAALGDYGGPTPTMPPRIGSPAFDAAIGTGNSPANDQRGVLRPQGAEPDIGAVELADTDGDGIVDVVEIFNQTNPNSIDSDGDGLVDGAGGVVSVSVYPDGIDSANDGLVDGELDLGTDPTASNVGDVAPRGNMDNIIDLGDLMVLTNLVTGAMQPTTLESMLGDIYNDDELNAADILLLQQMIMNSTAP